MSDFVILMAVALLCSAVGFYQFVYFISVGYGLSIAGLGVALLVMLGGSLTPAAVITCVLLILYGLRLGGFLLLR